jgi:predicted enzyme related to lactoylglutathione lyase
MNPTFIWYELMTTDQSAAIDFYSRVVGWTTAPHPGSEAGGAPYMVLSANGRGVGGVFQLTEEMTSQGASPMWLGYVGVDDADDMAKRIEAAGGSLRMGPADIPGVGRFALAADPGGALFYILAPQPQGDPPPPVPPMTPGHCGWHELHAGQGEKAAFDFYCGLFGWETVREMDMGAMGVYRIFGAGGTDLGGMMDKTEQLPSSVWAYYFVVDGIDSAADRVRDNGGTVRMGPMEVPDGNWIIQASDPQGVVFSLVSPRR